MAKQVTAIETVTTDSQIFLRMFRGVNPVAHSVYVNFVASIRTWHVRTWHFVGFEIVSWPFVQQLRHILFLSCITRPSDYYFWALNLATTKRVKRTMEKKRCRKFINFLWPWAISADGTDEQTEELPFMRASTCSSCDKIKGTWHSWVLRRRTVFG